MALECFIKVPVTEAFICLLQNTVVRPFFSLFGQLRCTSVQMIGVDM